MVRLDLMLFKDQKEYLRTRAKKLRVTVAAYIRSLILEDMEKNEESSKD